MDDETLQIMELADIPWTNMIWRTDQCYFIDTYFQTTQRPSWKWDFRDRIMIMCMFNDIEYNKSDDGQTYFENAKEVTEHAK